MKIAVDLANNFFFAPVSKDHKKLFAFNWQGQKHILTVLSQSNIHFPVLSHILILRELNNFSITPNNMAVHYIGISY